MKILVTGGSGFIGSNFIHYWLREHPEDSIVNLDKLTYAGNLDNLKDIEKNPHYQFVQGDICDLNLVRDLLESESIDTIVNFAAQSHVDQSMLHKDYREDDLKKLSKKPGVKPTIYELFKISLPGDFILNNVWGTHILLEAAVKEWQSIGFKNKHFHHVSTDEVFGTLELDSHNKFNEETVYDPRSPYSASKAASDHLVRAYYTTFDLPITISNTSNNYGPFQYPEKLLSLAITNLIQDKKVPIYGDGKYVRDWLYVEDHCRGIDLILQKGKVGETYCIGGLTDDINNLELIKKILKIMGKGDDLIEFVKDRPGHDRRYAIDWTKAKKELGYKPKFLHLTSNGKRLVF